MNSLLEGLSKLKNSIRVTSTLKNKADGCTISVSKLLHLIQLYIHPSREGQGITDLEAIYDILQCGKLVIKKNEGNQFREALLALWKHLLGLMKQPSVNQDIKKLGRWIILSIVDGENFSLSEMKKYQVSPHEDVSLSKERLKLTETMQNYRTLLISTLRYTTGLIHALRDIPPILKEDEFLFCARIFAVVFIRVPSISSYMNTRFREANTGRKWVHPRRKKVNFFSMNNMNNKEKTSLQRKLGYLFDWKQFTPYLSGVDDNDLIPENTTWIERLIYDGEFFFLFTRMLISHVNRVTVRVLNWTDVSYCEIIARISLDMLREACYRQWSDVNLIQYEEERCFFGLTNNGIKNILKHSEILLVDNLELINDLILIVYESTNAFNTRSVECCLLQLERWLIAACSSGKQSLNYQEKEDCIGFNDPLPLCVDAEQLLSGVTILFHSDHFEVLKKILLFIFKQLDFYVGDLRQNIVDMLMKDSFRLFLHWNREVRSYYHHILIYKIVRANRIILSSRSDKILVSKRNQVEITLLDFEDHPYGAIDQRNWSKFDAFLLSLLSLPLNEESLKLQPSHSKDLDLEKASLKNLSCPDKLLIYASTSLADYSDALHVYYHHANSIPTTEIVPPPPLGFC